MRKTNKILVGILLIAIMFLGIGYSAIQNITLNITGTITATALPYTKYTKPYLPDGFRYSEGNLDSGLVIQDSYGNQYVWIEVPMSEEVYDTIGLNFSFEGSSGGGLSTSSSPYEKVEKELQEYANSYRVEGYKDSYSATTGLSSGQYIMLKQNMLKSIYTNGGFYVGKYEAGIAASYRDFGLEFTTVHATTETSVIKANAYPYNWITCSQAQSLANSMLSGEYTSSLMFGLQWDLMLKYLETKGISQYSLKENSTNWGNYMNSEFNLANVNAKYSIYDLSTGSMGEWIAAGAYTKPANIVALLTTGSTSEFKKQNIYDLAGNMFEWTLEYSSDPNNPSVIRGGACNGIGNIEDPASRRFDCINNYNVPNIAFRVCIF